jgi:L-fucose isomerase-like protein
MLRIETDDIFGEIKALLAEGKYTDDPLKTYGGFGVVEIPKLQDLLKSLCLGGFAHHVAATLNEVGDLIYEALFKYLGYNTIYHNQFS